ncbi:fimbrial protein [Kosakonia oryzendophytica]|uniref:fimbrial protein n=1 Tax=Kosakonia oryzendophytica TaxID=1005665 RepID=UPI003D3342C6
MLRMSHSFSVLFAFGLMSAPLVSQANNIVYFMGEVSEQTCTIKINNSAASPIVLLPTVSKSQLASSGSTAGDTPFTVTLDSCNSQGTTAGIVFVANEVDGRDLKNIATRSPATNVAIQLLEGATTLSFTGNKAQTAMQNISGGATSANFDLVARYYATGVATAGTVEGQAQFAVTYL